MLIKFLCNLNLKQSKAKEKITKNKHLEFLWRLNRNTKVNKTTS